MRLLLLELDIDVIGGGYIGDQRKLLPYVEQPLVLREFTRVASGEETFMREQLIGFVLFIKGRRKDFVLSSPFSIKILKAKNSAWTELLATINENPWGFPYRIVLKRLSAGPNLLESWDETTLERLLPR